MLSALLAGRRRNLGGDYAAEVAADSPAIHWQFTETTGSVTDSSGNGRHGSVSGAVTRGVPSLTGTGAEFAGGLARIADGPHISQTPTVELLARVDGSSHAQLVAIHQSLQLYVSGARLGLITWTPDGVARRRGFLTYTLAPGWHHFALTADGTVLRVYVDGIRVYEGGFATLARASGYYLNVGGQTYASEPLIGVVDDFAYYNRPLPPGRIRAHARAAGLLYAPISPPAATAIPYPLPTTPPWNVPTPAVTPTPDGTGQAVHPSVIDMHRHTGGHDWHGWRYWMAMTPYGGSNTLAENPCILASRDGYTWHIPLGVHNPVYPKPPEALYQSDPHMVYDPDEDRLVLVCRGMIGGIQRTYVGWSYDGSTWTDRIYIDLDGAEYQTGSPALVWRNGSWELYATGGNPAGVYRWTSTDLINWSTRTRLQGLDGVADIWHLDVQHFDGQYWMTIDVGPMPDTTNDGLVAASSLDGLTWAAAAAPFMTKLPAETSLWQSHQLYRSVTQPKDATYLWLWYGGEGPRHSWWTGLTQVPRSEWPAPPT